MNNGISTHGDLRLGVVGFGKVVRDYYLPALRAIPDARVVAVADPLAESRRAATERLEDVKVYPGHREMLKDAGLDGVLVASPPSTHFEIWSDTTAYGLATFVEKPLVLSSQLVSLANRREQGIMIDFNRRLWPTYGRVRDVVRGGELGTPIHIDFGLHLNVFSWSTVTQHRLAAREGGLLNDLGCHAIDLVLEIIGEEPDAIRATAPSQPQRTGNQLGLSLTFRSGSSATCHLSYGTQTREWLIVAGPKSTLRLTEPNKAVHVESNGTRRRLSAWSLDVAVMGYRGIRRSQSMGRASIRGALGSFIHSLQNGLPFIPGFDDGFHNARWVAAAERSAASEGLPERYPSPPK